MAPRVQSLEAPSAPPAAPLEAKIHFLTPGSDEPVARYYGYFADRRRGWIRFGARRSRGPIACRLEALPDAAAAADVDRLGLVSIPTLREAGATRVEPGMVLRAYDFRRAQRWLRAAGFAVGRDFNPASAVVFVGSRRASRPGKWTRWRCRARWIATIR